MKKVAVVGAGVAGLSATWHLHKNTEHEVHLFEKEDRLGGHACTVQVNDGSKIVDVDIGFMVFNNHNYPNLVKWFQDLGVKDQDSDMSFSVSLDGGKRVEWSSDGLNGLLANRWQLLSGSFHSFVQDMLRFNREAPQLLQLHQDDPRRFVTMGQYLRDHHYSQAFCIQYVLPMVAAIWSANIDEVLDFPAEQLISFMCNHKLLQILDRPQWKTVVNRSQTYTKTIESMLGDKAHLSTPILDVKKANNGGYELFTTASKSLGVFDEVVFACHPPTTFQMLQSAADPALLECLEKIGYADNDIYVHSDTKLMPSRRRAWTSWNCIGKEELLSKTQHDRSTKKSEAFEGGESGFGSTAAVADKDTRMKAVYVTYWLNRLQKLDTDKEIFVSLNPHELPEASTIHHKLSLAHPQFNMETLHARKTLAKGWQGKDGLWFCGAWQGYGFHEDGCRSGFEVATQLSGVALPWADSKQMVLPPPDLSKSIKTTASSSLSKLYKSLTYDLPVAVCKRLVSHFLKQAVKHGKLLIKLNDGSIMEFGDGSRCGSDASPVTMRVFDPWFFVKTALEYDLGLGRSYMAGHFVIEPLKDVKEYDCVLRPLKSREETTGVIGDPVGLIRLFLLFIGNRDGADTFTPRKAANGVVSNALTTASGLFIAKIGAFLNYVRFKLTMDNSERGGSLKNIHAHYDLSNDLFKTFLDKDTMMYSSAIYDAVKAPLGRTGLVFRGSLEEAQWRKLDTLLERAQVQPGQRLLDIGFGWGGLSLHAANKYGCQVHAITLSVEQKALAIERAQKAGLSELITFEVVDYRTFARRKENQGKFDRIISCEMIEAVGHNHLGEFFWSVERLLSPEGVFVMEAITTPEQRYETYRRSTDFINSVVFPGGCCPSLHALVDAAYKNSSLTLEHLDNIGLHYAQTLADWRRRFNAKEAFVRSLGFDDVFMRVWNYYLTYCEAGFYSQTVNCHILVFARQGCVSLAPLFETRSVTQATPLTEQQVVAWLAESEH